MLGLVSLGLLLFGVGLELICVRRAAGVAPGCFRVWQP